MPRKNTKINKPKDKTAKVQSVSKSKKNSKNTKNKILKAITQGNIPLDVIKIPNKPKPLPLYNEQAIWNFINNLECLDVTSEGYETDLKKAKADTMDEINKLFDIVFEEVNGQAENNTIQEKDEVPADCIKIPFGFKPPERVEAMWNPSFNIFDTVDRMQPANKHNIFLNNTRLVFERLKNTNIDDKCFINVSRSFRDTFGKEVNTVLEDWKKEHVEESRQGLRNGIKRLPMENLVRMFKEEALSDFHEKSVFNYIKICAKEHKEVVKKKSIEQEKSFRNTESQCNQVSDKYIQQKRRLFTL